MNRPPLLGDPFRISNQLPILFGGFLIIAVSARFVLDHKVPTIPCLFRHFLGLPCLLCGGTRSLASLANLDLVASVGFSPLVFFAVFFSGSGSFLWFLERFGLFSSSHWFSGRLSGVPLRLMVLVVVVIHWVYLVYYLPG